MKQPSRGSFMKLPFKVKLYQESGFMKPPSLSHGFIEPPHK